MHRGRRGAHGELSAGQGAVFSEPTVRVLFSTANDGAPFRQHCTSRAGADAQERDPGGARSKAGVMFRYLAGAGSPAPRDLNFNTSVNQTSQMADQGGTNLADPGDRQSS